MDKIRKAPLRKMLAIWAAMLTSFVIIYCLIVGIDLPIQIFIQIKEIMTYVVSITIGAYYTSSSYEAVRKKKGEGDA